MIRLSTIWGCRVVAGIVLLCSPLWATLAFAISGVTASDTVVKNGTALTDCSAGTAPNVGSLACLGGRSGGQNFIGATNSSGNLILRSNNSGATLGKVIFGAAAATAYDEANERFGIGTASPAQALHVAKSIVGNDLIAQVQNTDNSSSASNAELKLSVGGTLAGDPFILFDIPGGSPAAWSVGADNSNADNFTISRFALLGNNNALTINATNVVSLDTLQILHAGATDGLLFQSTLTDRSNFQIYFNDILTYTTSPALVMIPIIMRQAQTFNFVGTSNLGTGGSVIDERHFKMGDGDKLALNTNGEGTFRSASTFERTGTTGQIFVAPTDCTGSGTPISCCTGSGTGPTCISEWWPFGTATIVDKVILPVLNDFVVNTPVPTNSGAITTERGFYVRTIQGTTKIAFQSDDTTATTRLAGAVRIGDTNVPIPGAKLQVVGNIVSAETSAFAHANLGGL